MSGSWAATMQAAFLAALARPAWWAQALASFLLRGGIVLALLPIIGLPTTADLTKLIAPTVQDVLLGGPSVGTIAGGAVLVFGGIAAVYALAYVGAWLDLELLRDASTADDVDLGWSPVRTSPLLGLAVRLSAHVPTTLALGYASIRLVQATYRELTSPSDPALALPARVIREIPDALLVLAVAWLVGEAVGGVAARRVAAGEPVVAAFGRSFRQVASPRGLATLASTTALLALFVLPYALAVFTAWQNVRTALFDGADPVLTLAALVLMVATWLLGLAVLGALLAWRATAWTMQIAPRAAAVTQPMLQASEPSR